MKLNYRSFHTDVIDNISRALKWAAESWDTPIVGITVHPSHAETAGAFLKEHHPHLELETCGGVFTSEVWLTVAEPERPPQQLRLGA